MTHPEFPLLKVAQILDRYTVVATGHNIEKLREDQRLTIMSVAKPVPGTSSPLVQPKVEVRVTMVAGDYVTAATPVEFEEVEVSETGEGLTISSLLGRTKTTKRQVPGNREKLHVQDGIMTGNPGNRPVEIGDYVIQWSDIKAFVAWLAEQEATAQHDPG